jgi:D-amino-acid dehydrogenase
MTQKVVVIGAGIVGVSTAIWARRDGHDVVLIDREGPAAGTSYGNGGVLASASVVPVTTPGLLRRAPRMLFSPEQPLFLKWRYLPRLLPFLLPYARSANAVDARKRAQALEPIIGDSLSDHLALATGTPAERYVVPTDYLFLYNDRAHYESDSFAWDLRRELGFKWDVLEGAAFHAYDAAFGPAIGCAAVCPDHGRISDPGAYVQALARHAEDIGVRFLKAEVSDIVSEGNTVTGVRAGGETVPCDSAVLAAGVWSGALARKLGVKVPMESERGYHLELWEPSVMPRAPVMVASGKFVATPMDGRLRLAGIVEFGGLDAPPSAAPFRLLERNIRAAIPGLTWAKTTEWMGHRPSVADSTPLIGPAPRLNGAFCAFGHDHVGLTGGPKTGRLISQLLSGRDPNIDMSPYAPARYAVA